MLMDGIDAASAAYEVGYESKSIASTAASSACPQSAASRLQETASCAHQRGV